MEINCPKCNKPLKLLNEDLHGDSTDDAGKTGLAGGVLCEECGRNLNTSLPKFLKSLSVF